MSQDVLLSSKREAIISTAIATWLQEHESGKRTHADYQKYIHVFRSLLQGTGRDLDGLLIALDRPPTEDEKDEAITILSMAAQAWASHAERKERVSGYTYNQRLASLSSFYKFAITRRFLKMDNPIVLLKRRSTQEYAHVEPLLKEEVLQVLGAMDRSTLAGKRDYALLLVFISTGRRASEMLSLQWRHVRIVGDKIILHFEHCKGDKEMHDNLEPRVVKALLDYLRDAFKEKIASLSPEQFIWLSLSNRSRGNPLTRRGLADVFKGRLKILGLETTNIHKTRHTYAYNAIKSGANILDVQKKLGHSTAATTSRYLESMSGFDDTHVGKLLDFLEIE